MYKIILPNIISNLLWRFRDLFTAPSFEYFCAFVLGFMILESKRCVTNIILSSNIKKHWTNFYRFLKSYKWSKEKISQRLFELFFCVIKPEREKEGRLNLYGVVDDTYSIKCGEKIYGTSFFVRKLKNSLKKLW